MEDTVQEISASQILAAGGDPKRVRTVKRYDFKRPDKFSLEQIRTFHMIHEVIARGLAATVSTRIGRPAEVGVHAVDQLTYAEFIASVPDESVFAIVALPPLRGSITVQIDGSLARLVAEAACGQNAATLSLPARVFTEVDALLIESVMEEFLPSFRDGWRSLVELSPTIGAVGTAARDAMIVPPTEMTILASLRVTVGTEQAFINVAFPYLTIEPLVHLLSAQRWYSKVGRPGASTALGSRAADIPVICELSVPVDAIALASLPSILGGEPVPLPALDRGSAELRVGSVAVARLHLDADLLDDESLALEVENRRGRYGIAGAAGVGGRGGERPGAADEREGTAAAVIARIDPALHELRSEVRNLRIAVGEIAQNRGMVAVDELDMGAADARTPYIDSPRDVALLLCAEAPATVAFLVAPLEPQTAAQILSALDPPLRDETVRSLTTLESADLALHARVLTFLRRRIQTRRDSSVAGGPEAVAQILNHVPRSVEKAVMERFMTEDQPLFESIARLLFVFEDFVLVDPVAIRKVADQVEADELALALKGVPREVAAHILGALDEERVGAIEQAESSLGRVRRSDVESAQRDLIEELRHLEERGEVVIARPDEVVE